MKKFIAILLVVATMILCLTGCGGKKATAVVTFENVTDAYVAGFPLNRAGCGVGMEENHIMTVNVTHEGVYPFVISANNTEYTFTVTYENGKITAEADSGLSFTIK